MNGGIYKIQNLINGDIYIGQAIDFKDRIKRHFPPRTEEDSYLHRAIKKYGSENFSVEILETYTDKEKYLQEIDEREQYWIKYYHCYVNDPLYQGGYNNTPGGKQGHFIHTSKKVYQFSLRGEFIAVYDSIAEAGRETDTNPAAIRKNLNGICKHANGFLWSENDFVQPLVDENYRHNERKLLQYDVNNNYIKTYNNIEEVYQEFKISKGNLSRATRSNTLYGGYRWRYEDSFLPLPQLDKNNFYKIDKQTGEKLKEYQSLKEAALESGIHYSSISKCLSGTQKTAGGYKWQWKYSHS